MKKILFILFGMFGILSFIYWKYYKEYTQEIETTYIKTIQKEVEILISEHLSHSLTIAKSLLINEDILKCIKKNNYQNLSQFIDSKFKINFISPKGELLFTNFAYNMVGKNIKKARTYAPISTKEKAYINAGVYGISIKGDVPVIINHEFKGIFEIITGFDSIIKELQKQKIEAAIILTKKYSKKVKFTKLGFFENSYFILKSSSPKIKKEIKNIPSILNTDYLYKKGYFITSVPIYSNKELVGYFILFIKDINNLGGKKVILEVIGIILILIFIFLVYLAFRTIQINENIISTLNKRVKEAVNKNLEILYKDSLTGVYNKTKLEIDKNQHINEYAILLNIKNFSKINEIYGFKKGDEILIEVANKLKNILNKEIYRIDGNEFIFFSKNPDKDIDKIISYFNHHPISIEEMKIRINFSFAVAKNDSDELLRKLSIAQQEAKKKIFQKYVMYEEKETNKDFIKFNSLLYDALYLKEKAQIIPFYQPIVDNKTLKPKKYEVLARLKTEEKIYTPYFFLEVARSSGFLADLTKEIIKKSFKTAAKHNIHISINITDEDLLIEGFKEFLISQTKLNNLSPNQITLEILENITSQETNTSIELLKELKKEGFLIAIDDFGVEYSNFERISDLDVDFIKIDGKYIKNIDNPKNYQIVKAITTFAHSMDIKVIAEFVENKEILKTLRKLNIECSQGYYFSPPKEEL